MVAVFVAGCSFDVIGTNVGDPTGGGPAGTPSPTQSVPNADSGIAATTPPPTAPADMSAQRVGTACMNDAQCDPGLFCAKTFGIGPGHVDIPGGYCTLDCSSTACPANSYCQTLSFGKYCLSSCPPDPCRGGGPGGYICCDYGGGQKGCSTDALCPKKGG